MNDEQTVANDEQTLQTEPEIQGPDMPFLFGCSLWVPVFAVLVYFFMWFLRPRPQYGQQEQPEDEPPSV